MLASLALVLVLAAPAAAAAPDWRLGAEPRDTAESALREAARRDDKASAEALVGGLLAFLI